MENKRKWLEVIKKLSVFSLALLFALSATFSQAEAAIKYKDVSTKHSAYKSIQEVAAKGIIKGDKKGNFNPNGKITNAQSAIIIVKTLGVSTKKRPNPKFKDVSTKTTGYAEIATLVDLGVIKKSTYFKPTKATTRAEMSKMLTLAFKFKGTSSKTKKIKDVSKKNVYYSSIDKFMASGVGSGTSTTKFSPNSNVTRAQMAVFVDKILKQKKKAPVAKEPVVKKPVVKKPAPKPVAKPATVKKPEPKKALTEEEKLAEGILKAVNAERAKAKVPALKIHPEVQKIAEMKSKDMAENNYYGHLSPTYGSYSDMLNKAKVARKAGGENLLVGYTLPEAVVKGWMESPGHKKNILNPDYTHTGIASHAGGDYGMYHTQIFIKQ